MIEDHFKWIKVWEDLIVNEDYVSKTVLELKENIIDSIYFKINEGPDLNKLKYKKHLFLDWLREQNVDQNKITIEADNLTQDENVWPNYVRNFNENPFLYGQDLKFVSENNIKKQFGMFIGSSRWPRLYFASYMFKNYKEQCIMSFNQHLVNDSLLYEKTNNDDKVKQMVEAFKKHLPLNIDIKSNNYIHYDRACDICSLYNNFNIDLVFETWWEGQTFMPTEKTARPLLTKTPFIAFGPKHYLKNLKRLGFKTFNEYIPEDYDNYEGLERLHKIAEVVDTVKDLNKTVMEPILEHNKNVYLNLDKQKIRQEFGCR
jgi:hypothetical protein